MAKATKHNPSKSPAFASIVQPNYTWAEMESLTIEGITVLPPKAGGQATLISPSIDDPMARHIRLHELMHAKHTPSVNAVFQHLEKSGLAAPTSVQLAEDIRLEDIMRRNDLKPADAYVTDEFVTFMTQDLKAYATPMRVALRFLSMYGTKVESGWDTTDVGQFLGKTGLAGAVDAATVHNLVETARDLKAILARNEADTGAISEQAKDRKAKALADVLTRRVEMCLRDVIEEEEKKTKGDKGSPKDGGEGESQNGEGSKSDESKEGQSGEGSEAKSSQDQEDKEPKPESEGNKGGQGGKSGKRRSPVSDRLGGTGARPEKPQSGISERAAFLVRSKSHDEQIKEQTTALREMLDAKKAEEERGRIEARMRAPRPAMERPEFGGFDGPIARSDIKHDIDADLAREFTIDPLARWGEMDIKMRNLVRNFRALVPSNGRAALDGVLPKHWSRWFTDRAILDSRGMRRGGTLLIDVSGSMSWAHEVTQELIQAIPAMTVALYSTSRERNGAGLLSIIARGGKVVANDWNFREHHSGGNLVDGPALAWLIRQPKPRVWFSDGEVTGLVRDGSTFIESQSAFHAWDSKRLAALGSVTRTTDPKEVRNIFKGKARGRPVVPPGAFTGLRNI